MVKGYDPTRSDVSSLLLNHLFQLLSFGSTLKLDDAHKYVKYWLGHSQYTSSLYKKFATMKVRPILKLKRQCGLKQTHFPQTSQRKADANFPTKIKDNQITICLDNMRNKLELKQNLDRQLTFFHRTQLNRNQNKSYSSIQEEQNNLIKSLYQSCYAGYRNYMLDDHLTKQMSIICSKYLFFRQTKNNIPLDRLFRYTTQLADNMLL